MCAITLSVVGVSTGVERGDGGDNGAHDEMESCKMRSRVKNRFISVGDRWN